MVYEQSVGKMDGAARTGFGNTVLNWYAESLERALGFRAGAGGEHFVDYGFREFVDNPKAVVDRIYSHFDIAMSPDTERALLEHVAQHKKGQHGVHEYTLENYGLDDSTVRDRFAFYMEHPLI